MIVVYTCITLLAGPAEIAAAGGLSHMTPVHQERGTSVYQSPEAFIHNAFNGTTPARQKLWISGELKNDLTAVLGHPPKWLRVSFWQQGSRTAWILEEIGKEQPITTGVIVADGKIEQVRVLVYRESRGFEVRYPFFTDQFHRAALDDHNQLDQNIDGITGATLSVRALEHMARVALLLHSHANKSSIILAKQ